MPINPIGAGKGSLPRKVSYAKFYDNHEHIFGKSGVPHGGDGSTTEKNAERILPTGGSAEPKPETEKTNRTPRNIHQEKNQ